MKQYTRRPQKIFAEQFRWGLETGVQNLDGVIYRNANLYHESMGEESQKHKGYLAIYDKFLDRKGFKEGEWNPFCQITAGQRIYFNENTTHYILRYDPKTDYVDGVEYKEDFEKKYTEV